MKPSYISALIISSIITVTSISIRAQGQDQGAVEVDIFAKRYFTDNKSNMSNGNLLGSSLGYYLTDEFELALSHGVYGDIRAEQEQAHSERYYCGRQNSSYISNCPSNDSKKIMGSLTSLDAIYNFGLPGIGLRPYISTGVAHQSIDQYERSGRNHSTFANIGAGLKYYLTENVSAKASMDGMYNIDSNQSELMAGLSLGVIFGGPTKKN